MSFKRGDWVLVSNGAGGYALAQVARVESNGYQLIHGHYTTFWRHDACHKPPRSLLIEKGSK